eukprot:2444729-Ditylum_brightwellii.AAC.1
MTQFCESRPLVNDNLFRNNIHRKDTAYVGNEVTAESNLHPISKECIQVNVPQFGSIKSSSLNDIVPTPFPNIDPRNPTSDKHPHLYNHASIGNLHKVSMDKIRAKDNSILLCSPCDDESFQGSEGESSNSTSSGSY